MSIEEEKGLAGTPVRVLSDKEFEQEQRKPGRRYAISVAALQMKLGGVSRVTIRKWVHGEKLPTPIGLPSGKLVWFEDEIDSALFSEGNRRRMESA